MKLTNKKHRRFWRRSSRWRKAYANAKTLRHQAYLLALAGRENPFKGAGFWKLMVMQESQRMTGELLRKLHWKSPWLESLKGTDVKEQLSSGPVTVHIRER